MAAADTSKDTTNSDDVVIKKYANRRLYNTATSSYVTLDDLCQMVKDGKDFVVFDAKSGDDITRSVLTQIIFEEEGKGQNLLPISFLRQLIRFYDDSLRALLPSYLDASMESFSKHQEDMRRTLSDALGDFNPFRRFEEMGRQNIAMVKKAVGMFSPPGFGDEEGQQPGPAQSGTAPKESQEEIDAIKAQLEAMQQRLDSLSDKK